MDYGWYHVPAEGQQSALHTDSPDEQSHPAPLYSAAEGKPESPVQLGSQYVKPACSQTYRPSAPAQGDFCPQQDYPQRYPADRSDGTTAGSNSTVRP
ncbi:hypothetical protein D3C71_1349630 [compost metagenome]